MIRQLVNSARILLEIGVLIGLLLLIYWWNPLGIFGGKLKLQPTATLSVQVRDLGELVTAEYYGEVISTIEEAQVEKLEEPDLQQHAISVVDEIKEMLEYLRNFSKLNPAEQSLRLQNEDTKLSRRDRRRLITDEVSRNNILDRLRFHGEWEAFELMPMSADVLGYLAVQSEKRAQHIQYNLNDRQIGDLLFNLYSNPKFFADYWKDDDFIVAYYQQKLSQLPKNEQRKRLAMIGRGTVKAGFDLRELTPNMFYINEVSKELHFFGLAPKILNADINPWFIPEKGVAGFDILTYNGRVNFKDAKKVKQYAVQKLETNAQKANILESAEKFGGESLKRLFSLMTGKEIERVFFHHDRIVQLSQQIMKDRFINYEEAVLFERALSAELHTIDSLQNGKENRFNNQQLANQKWNVLQQIVQDMQQFAFENDDSRYGYFSTWAYQMAYKGVLDSTAKAEISTKRMGLKNQSVLADSAFLLWANADTMQLIEHYNQAIAFLLATEVPVGEKMKLEYAANEISQGTVDNFRANLVFKSKEKAIFEYIRTSSSDSTFLTQALFPFRYERAAWENLINRRFVPVSAESTQIRIGETEKERISVYSPADSNSLKVVPVALSELINPILLSQIANREAFCLTEKLCIIMGSRDFDPRTEKPAPPAGLSAEQRQELAQFIDKMLVLQEQQVKKGPFLRANEWVWKRLEESKMAASRTSDGIGR